MSKSQSPNAPTKPFSHFEFDYKHILITVFIMLIPTQTTASALLLNSSASVIPEDLVSPVLLPEVHAEQLVVRPPPLLAGGLQQRLGAGVEAALAERLEDDAVRGHDGLGVAVEPVEREREVPREPAP